MDLTIREELPEDGPRIHALNVAAFGGDAEARLVDALRANGRLTLSLVAVERGAVVGHLAFSPVSLATPSGRVARGIGLAPMAVAPARQRCGIGGRLVTAGLERMRAAGHRFCVVLGHPEYYPRFGFVRASGAGIRWERAAPDEAFLVLELAPFGLTGLTGVVRYGPEFDAV